MAIGFNPQPLAGRTDYRSRQQANTVSGNPRLANNVSFGGYRGPLNPASMQAPQMGGTKPMPNSPSMGGGTVGGRSGAMPGFSGQPPWASYMSNPSLTKPGMGGMQPTKPGLDSAGRQTYDQYLESFMPTDGGAVMAMAPIDRNTWERQQQQLPLTKPGMAGPMPNGVPPHYVPNEQGGWEDPNRNPNMMQSADFREGRDYYVDEQGRRINMGTGQPYQQNNGPSFGIGASGLGSMPQYGGGETSQFGGGRYLDQLRNQFGGNWYGGPQNNQMLNQWWGNQVSGVGRYQPPMFSNMRTNEWIGGNNPYRYNLPNNFGG